MILPGILASGISGHLFSSNFYSIATVTASGSSNTITFSSIPQTYTHLQVRIFGRTSRGATSDNLAFNPNGSAVTTGHYLYGDGSSVNAGSSNPYIGPMPATGVSSNIFGAMILDVLDYTNTNKNIVVRSLEGYDANGSGVAYFGSVLQTSVGPLNSFTITNYSGTNFISGSSFALYGVK